MSRTVFAYDAAMDDGTVLVFRPRPHGRVGSGIAYGIVNAPVVVGRVKEIVHAVQFDNGGAFHDGGGDVGGGCFPLFGALHALLQGAGNDFTFGEVELCYPYKVSVTEAHVVQVILAVIIAEQEGVDIRKYSVIYDAIEEVKAAMEGMLAPELKEQVTATIEVREVFNITKVGLVAGAMVKTGKVKRSDKARLIRDGIVIFTGNINALKRFKDDVKEVGTNFECGISLVNCNDMKVGDMIETFEEIEVKQTL